MGGRGNEGCCVGGGNAEYCRISWEYSEEGLEDIGNSVSSSLLFLAKLR